MGKGSKKARVPKVKYKGTFLYRTSVRELYGAAYSIEQMLEIFYMRLAKMDEVEVNMVRNLFRNGVNCRIEKL